MTCLNMHNLADENSKTKHNHTAEQNNLKKKELVICSALIAYIYLTLQHTLNKLY